MQECIVGNTSNCPVSDGRLVLYQIYTTNTYRLTVVGALLHLIRVLRILASLYYAYRVLSTRFAYFLYNKIMKNFGLTLKEIRNEKKLTQKDIAKVLGISTTCYAGYEQGYREPDLKTLKKLCIILDVSADYLLGLEDEYGNNTRQSYNNYGIHTGDVKF